MSMLNSKQSKKQKLPKKKQFFRDVFDEKQNSQKEKFFNQYQSEFNTQLDQVFNKPSSVFKFAQPSGYNCRVQRMVFATRFNDRIAFLLHGIQNGMHILVHYQSEATNLSEGKIIQLNISTTKSQLFFPDINTSYSCSIITYFYAVGLKEIYLYSIKRSPVLSVGKIQLLYTFQRQGEQKHNAGKIIKDNVLVLSHDGYVSVYKTQQQQGRLIRQTYSELSYFYSIYGLQDVTCFFQNEGTAAFGIKNGIIRIFRQNKNQFQFLKSLYQNKTQIKQIIAIQQETLVAVSQNQKGRFLCIWNIEFQFRPFQIQITGSISCFASCNSIFIYRPNQIDEVQILGSEGRNTVLLSLSLPHIVHAFLQQSGQQLPSQTKPKLLIVDENGDVCLPSDLQQRVEPPLKQGKVKVKCTMSQDNRLVLLVQEYLQNIKQIVITLKNLDRQVLGKANWLMPNDKFIYSVKRGYCLISVSDRNNQLEVACYNKRKFLNSSEVYYIQESRLMCLKFKGEVDSKVQDGVFSRRKKCLYFYTRYNQVYEWQQEQPPKLIGKYECVMFLELKDDQTVLYIGLEEGSRAYDVITGEEFDLHSGKDTCEEGQLIGDLLLLVSKNKKSEWYLYSVTDLNWKQTVYRNENYQRYNAYINSSTNSLLSFTRGVVEHQLIFPNSKSTLSNFFSFSELVNIKAIVGGHCTKEHALKLLSKQKGSLLYYFNAAVLFAQEEVISVLLSGHQTFRKDGLILKDMDPIQYAMRSGFKQIGKKLLKKSSFKGVYSQFSTKGGQTEAMSELLVGYFRECPVRDLPPYGQIADEIQPIYSPTSYSYRIDLDNLRSDFDLSEDSSAIRMVQLSKPIDLARGSTQLIELLRCYRDYGDEKVLNSDAALLINYLENRHFLMQVCETILRLLILSVNMAAIFTQETILYQLGLAGILLTAVFELLSLNEVEYFFYYLNIIDLLVLIFVSTHNALALRGDREIVFTFFALALMELRLLFCLKIIRPIHYFFKVLINVTTEIIPFSFVLAICVVFFAINGYLSPIDPANPDLRAEALDSMLGTFFGQNQMEYLANLAPADKFVKWFVLFSRQLWLSVFMLNGILVGIVSGVYEEGEEKKDQITFKEKIILCLKYESVFARLKAITRLGLAPNFLHAFVTNKSFTSKKSEVVQCKEEIVESVIEGEKSINKQLSKLKQLALILTKKTGKQQVKPKEEQRFERKERIEREDVADEDSDYYSDDDDDQDQ